MKEFLGDDFLLDNELALKLYKEHASKMPIFDYHCHLVPQQIAENYHFSSITEAWLGKNGVGDHYKWRLLREIGVDEEYITGNRSDWERFEKFASVLPYFIGNPLYEWCHLELKTYFGITKPLNKDTAKEIYDECNEQLKTMGARDLLAKVNCIRLCTTDDPADDLHYHEMMAKDPTLKIKVAPAWRPDKAMNIENATFLPWLERMEKAVGYKIEHMADLVKALDERLVFFINHGCVTSDQGIEILYYSHEATLENAEKVLQKKFRGEEITSADLDIFKGYLLLHLGREYHKYNMVQQYHIGPTRNNPERLYKLHGPDFGYDGAGDSDMALKLVMLLSDLDKTDELTKTVLYSINEKDYISLVTTMNCFQDGKVKGKIQLGAAWWFNDHYDGMKLQMQKLADDGLLSCFIGMLTDSRSFLSYTRHDYFRRELCQILSEYVYAGRYPRDEKILGEIVENICYNNAIEYFKTKEVK